MDVAHNGPADAGEYPGTPRFGAAIARQAEQDADDVALLLKQIGFLPEHRSAESPPIGLPPDVLMGLALATRFARWEVSGIQAHLQAGLPSSASVLNRIAHAGSEPEFPEFVSQLRRSAFRIFHESFIWLIDDEAMTAEVAMTAIDDEEQFLDILADFLLGQNRENSQHDK